jgi:anaerobic selenocysteine-containing dehydrogenase
MVTTFIGKKSAAAGGWGALKSCGKKLLASGSPLTGARTMLKANQPDGFDCPGCAWGDPEHGSSFEFCENGVKAVAWEATEKACHAGILRRPYGDGAARADRL